MEYFFHIAVLVGLYGTLALALDLVAGTAGLMSTAHAAFYGFGAYATAVVVVTAGRAPWVGLLVGLIIAALLSLLVSLPSLRLHDDYFVLAAFGFQIIASAVFLNWIGLTGGPMGIAGVRRPLFLDWRIDSSGEFALAALLLAGLAVLIVSRLSNNAWGRVLRAIREHESFAQSLGKNVFYFKVATFGASAALSAAAGSLFAHYFAYVDPSSFTLTESILILAMVVIGGAGTRWGPVLGAVVLVTIPEVLRFIGLPGSVAANLRQILFGSALVCMMMFRPQGLLGGDLFSDAPKRRKQGDDLPM